MKTLHQPCQKDNYTDSFLIKYENTHVGLVQSTMKWGQKNRFHLVNIVDDKFLHVDVITNLGLTYL